MRGCVKAVAGRLAQLEEHLVYTEGVGGSSPSSPTISALYGCGSGCALTPLGGSSRTAFLGSRPRGRSSVG
jgi:hypothetical protein